MKNQNDAVDVGSTSYRPPWSALATPTPGRRALLPGVPAGRILPGFTPGRARSQLMAPQWQPTCSARLASNRLFTIGVW